MSPDLPGVLIPAAGTALSPAGAQAAGQLAAQLAAALHIQRLVDGLVAHPHHGIVRELGAQPPGDLHRRPPLGQPAAGLGGQPGTGELAGLGTAGLLAGRLMRPPRPVAVAAAVHSNFPRDRRHGLAQLPGDHRERLPGMQAQRDLFPVSQRQPARPGRPRIPRHWPARRVPHDQRHALMRAADLRADLP
jgi:hypothetical protein